MIDIAPYVNQETKFNWSDWTEEKFKQEKKFCDDWMQKNFNFNEPHKFKWGTIGSYSDKHSLNNGVIIRYNMQNK
ncbi:MAG: hypothetical protein AAGU14_11295 [Eubacteriaceae bacterium]